MKYVCAACEAELDTTEHPTLEDTLSIVACDTCENEEYEAGKNDGHDEGYDQGYDDGKEDAESEDKADK